MEGPKKLNIGEFDSLFETSFDHMVSQLSANGKIPLHKKSRVTVALCDAIIYFLKN
jgi:hypothetical protein